MNGPGGYLVRMMNLLTSMSLLSTIDEHGASILAVGVFGGCLGVFVTAERLVDAGLSRWWAGSILPAVASPWLFPLLIQGAKAHGILLQPAVPLIRVHR
jgi:uncharacterized membrane protein YhaH (DUF805 family)